MLGLAVVFIRPAFGDTSPDPCHADPNAPACVSGNGTGTFTGVIHNATPPAPGSATSSGNTPTALAETYVVYNYVPTCTGNTRGDAGNLCVAATTMCRPAGAGLIQYWRWEVTILRATGAEVSAVQSPGTFCLGPQVAGLPPVAAVGGVLASDLQRLIVLRGRAIVKPNGTTLVNYDTTFHTDAKSYVLAPVQLLSHRVVVTAHPKQYDWYFGDGTSALDAGPGQPDASDVSHRYRNTGSVSPYVVITWTGTFTVDGGAQREVFGTARTTGPGTPLQVKQARAELVTR
jgi:hypothetical protein